MSSDVPARLALAEQQLRAQREEIHRLRQEAEDPGSWGVRVLDGLPVAVLLLDEYGTVLHANSASGDMLHVPHMLLFGKPLTVFVSLGSRSAFRRAWAEVVRSGGEARVDVNLSSNGAAHIPAHLCLTSQAELTAVRRVRCVAVPCDHVQASPGTGTDGATGEGDGSSGAVTSGGSAGTGTLRLARALAEITALPLTCRSLSRLPARAAEAAARAVHGAAGAAVTPIPTATEGNGEAPADLSAASCSSRACEAAESVQRELAEGPTYDVARTGRSLVSENLRGDPRWPALGRRVAAHGLGSVVAVPLSDGDQLLGVLTVWAKPGGLRSSAETLVRVVGEACAATLAVARQLEEARAVPDEGVRPRPLAR